VLYYSIDFDNARREEIRYYDQYMCPDRVRNEQSIYEASAVRRTRDWILSILASSVLDVFAIQPLLLLIFAMVEIQLHVRRARKNLPFKKAFSSLSQA